MHIVILGKTGCGRCEACKEKFRLLGLKCTYVAMDNPNGWRKQGATDALAAAAWANMDISHPPIIVIDGRPYTYAGAMREAKRIRRCAGSQTVEQ